MLWRKIRRKISSVLTSARDNYVKTMIGDLNENSKPFWKFIKSQRKDNQAMPPMKTTSGQLVESDLDKAEALNSQFTQNFSQEDNSYVPFFNRAIPVLPDIVVSEKGVHQLLTGLKITKAAGPDEIHPRVLKELADPIAPVLSKIFQKSLTSSELPKDWLLANICPIFKKGDRSLPINYRPVSLTCITCKLLEHIVCSNIMSHLEKYDILSSNQHAFRRHHSCTTQLCSVVNDWTRALDKRSQVDVFILDFAKAFDTVPHERLKAKLFYYGICGTNLCWIHSFLCGRSQRVVVNGSKSKWSDVRSGVPQGTVLAPVLFNLFINDIVKDIESDVRLFADDCVCYRSISTHEDCVQLQQDISRLANWAKTWNMKFEPSKCKTMRITRKTKHNIQYWYSLDGVALDFVKHTKYLGITISDDLRWNRHVNDVCNRANRVLGLLRRNLHFCNSQVKEAAYMGLVRPMLEYASTVWDPYTENLISEVEKVQRRAARFVSSNYTNYESGAMTNILRELGWQSLQDRRQVARITLFNKGLHNLATLPLDSLTKPTRNSRHMHSEYFLPIFARTNVYKFSFVPRTIINWNNLHQSIIDKKSFPAVFQSMLQRNIVT